MKKKIVIVLSIIGLLTFVTAAWYFSITGDLDATVNSVGGYYSVNLILPEITLNTTEGPDSQNSSADFVYNKEGNFSVSITETFVDQSAGECSGGQGDCTIDVWIIYFLTDTLYEQEIINHGDYIYFPENSNTKTMIAELRCEAYSCPQTRTVRVNLEEI